MKRRAKAPRPIHAAPLAYQVIIRSIWERGREQEIALAELDQRRLWLTEEQKIQAGLSCAWPR